jgi:hypothetical protein
MSGRSWGQALTEDTTPEKIIMFTKQRIGAGATKERGTRATKKKRGRKEPLRWSNSVFLPRALSCVATLDPLKTLTLLIEKVSWHESAQKSMQILAFLVSRQEMFVNSPCFGIIVS